MTHFRLRWEKRGAHVHARLFSADHETMTHGKNGDLCFRIQEWEAFLRCFDSKRLDQVVVIPEDGKP